MVTLGLLDLVVGLLDVKKKTNFIYGLAIIIGPLIYVSFLNKNFEKSGGHAVCRLCFLSFNVQLCNVSVSGSYILIVSTYAG